MQAGRASAYTRAHTRATVPALLTFSYALSLGWVGLDVVHWAYPCLQVLNSGGLCGGWAGLVLTGTHTGHTAGIRRVLYSVLSTYHSRHGAPA